MEMARRMTPSAAAGVKCGSTGVATVSRRLAKAIPELRRLQKLLLSGENLDPRLLIDFRNALNHVRNPAWSAHQYIASQNTDQDPAGAGATEGRTSAHRANVVVLINAVRKAAQ